MSYHCVSLKNRFLLKNYVFLKNIVFAQYYVWNKLDCNYNKILQIVLWKVAQNTETDLLGPGPSSWVIQTKWHIYKKMP